MKKLTLFVLLAGAMLCSATLPAAQPQKIGMVNFKRVVEESKMGKQEQANFEVLKKQMETVLEEKEKALSTLEAKLSDSDYMDGLSDEKERDLKHQYRIQSQEISQIQNQYYQTLSQANMKILQKLNEIVATVAINVAKEQNLDVILNEDSGFYYSPDLDQSSKVVAALDALYETELKSSKAQ